MSDNERHVYSFCASPFFNAFVLIFCVLVFGYKTSAFLIIVSLVLALTLRHIRPIPLAAFASRNAYMSSFGRVCFVFAIALIVQLGPYVS